MKQSKANSKKSTTTIHSKAKDTHKSSSTKTSSTIKNTPAKNKQNVEEQEDATNKRSASLR